MLGLMRHTDRLAPHDPASADRAREVIADIAGAMGLPEHRIQHVGSTAVPDLPAKPILDFDVGVIPGETIDDIVQCLVRVGYIDRGDRDGGIGRLLIWEAAPEIRTIHMHITMFQSKEWRQDLAFRDGLRMDPALRQRYAHVKSDLADRFSADRKAYREAKGRFIRATLDLGMTSE